MYMINFDYQKVRKVKIINFQIFFLENILRFFFFTVVEKLTPFILNISVKK